MGLQWFMPYLLRMVRYLPHLYLIKFHIQTSQKVNSGFLKFDTEGGQEGQHIFAIGLH